MLYSNLKEENGDALHPCLLLTVYLCTSAPLCLQLALPAVHAPLDGIPLLGPATTVRVEAGGDEEEVGEPVEEDADNLVVVMLSKLQ